MEPLATRDAIGRFPQCQGATRTSPAVHRAARIFGRLVGISCGGACRSRSVQEFEISLAAYTSGAQDILDDENGKWGLPRHDNWPQNSRFSKDHLISSFASQCEPVQFENANQLLVGDWSDARHSPRLGGRDGKQEFLFSENAPGPERIAASLEARFSQNVFQGTLSGCFLKK
jgi:hypothetical protein